MQSCSMGNGSEKASSLMVSRMLVAFSDPFPIEQDCIHLQNGVYHLPDGSFRCV